MTGWWGRFDDFLATDPQDVGCDRAMEIMHEYAELLARGVDVKVRFPGMAAHLDARGACAEDVDGILDAVRDLG